MSVVYGLRVVSALSCWSALCLRSRLATLAQVRSSCPLMSVDVSFSLRLMVWKKSLRQCGALIPPEPYDGFATTWAKVSSVLIDAGRGYGRGKMRTSAFGSITADGGMARYIRR